MASLCPNSNDSFVVRMWVGAGTLPKNLTKSK